MLVEIKRERDPIDINLGSDTMPTQTDTPTSELSSITELKATGQLINKLQGGWDNIHAVNQDNFQKARVSIQQ